MKKERFLYFKHEVFAQFDNFIAYETFPGLPTFSNPFPPNPEPPVASVSTIVSVDVEDEDGIDIESIKMKINKTNVLAIC